MSCHVELGNEKKPVRNLWVNKQRKPSDKAEVDHTVMFL